MTEHLSRERISELVIASQNDDEKAHFDACPVCQTELTELRAAISAFGEAAREYSASKDSRELDLSIGFDRNNNWFSVTKVLWGLAAAMILLIAVWVPLHRRHESQQTAAWNAENLNAENDEVLMQQIDAEVSRRVPAAMDPLAKLSSDDSTNRTANSQTDSQGNGEK